MSQVEGNSSNDFKTPAITLSASGYRQFLTGKKSQLIKTEKGCTFQRNLLNL